MMMMNHVDQLMMKIQIVLRLWQVMQKIEMVNQVQLTLAPVVNIYSKSFRQKENVCFSGDPDESGDYEDDDEENSDDEEDGRFNHIHY
jgi:hypothetical protein